MTSSFVHLRVHTAYSLLEGAVRIPQLISLCQKHQMPAVAISDRDNLFGSMEFSQEAAGKGIQPIIGCQFSMQPLVQSSNRHAAADQLMLYAKDETGYRNLLQLASLTYLEPCHHTGPLLSYDTIAKHADGLIALSGGPMGGIGRALCTNRKDDAVQLLMRLKEIFPDRLYMELMRHGMQEEKITEADMLQMAVDYHLPLIATNDIYFHGDRSMHLAHDALLCIAEGRYISEQNRRRLTPEHRFKTAEEMRLLFADLPEAIDNTLVIAERCATMSDKRKPILPSFTITENGQVLGEEEALRHRARDGLVHRLETLVYTDDMGEQQKEEVAKPYFDRLAFELDVICSMKFPGYFLIVSDFITWSKENGIPVGPGRGSGAASVVAWSLLITDLDPLKYGLVFERFLNPERVSMPDFDIDFCQDRRDEVIRYVQSRYGFHQVAQIITFGKLQARAVLRDVGRVLQMPYGQVDRICKLVPNNPANPVTLEEAIKIEPLLRKYRDEDESVAKLIDTALKLEGLYRHCSTHAAGVVIADRALAELVPLYRDPRSEMPVVQYSMKYAEYAGLVKFDFLGLKTLTVLDHAVRHVAKRDINLDLLKLPEGDPKTYELLTRGDTVGIFQFESAGMRDSLRKLKPDCLEDLIALGALYRPGPMDNIPSYCNRKHGKEKPDYLHPMLEPVLKETHGVIIYQEQVQQIAQILAGYTLGGADLLRRAMGKKIKEEMDAQRAVFIEGAAKNGVDAKQAGSIFDLVDKFAGYGFNKAHAAAYALIGYQTAYLKANFPVEFLAASMTYDMHNTDKLAIFCEDVKRLGLCMLPPDINRSHAVFGVEWREKDNGDNELCIRYALGALKNVGEQAMAAVVAERERGGPFKDIFDFARRIEPSVINRRQMEQLIRSGAFDSLNSNRRQLFEAIDLIIGYCQAMAQEKSSNQISLFGESVETQPVPSLANVSDWAPLQRLEHEFGAVGFYLSSHPLEGYSSVLKRLHVHTYSSLKEKLGSQYTQVSLAGIVTGMKIKASDKGRFAFVQLSDRSAVYEASIFDETVLDTYRDLLAAGQMLHLRADAKMEESGPRIIITSIKPLDEIASQSSSERVELALDADVMAQGMGELKALIGMPQDKGCKVILLAHFQSAKTAEIHLDGYYRISPENLLHLQVMNGIREVKEA